MSARLSSPLIPRPVIPAAPRNVRRIMSLKIYHQATKTPRGNWLGAFRIPHYRLLYLYINGGVQVLCLSAVAGYGNQCGRGLFFCNPLIRKNMLPGDQLPLNNWCNRGEKKPIWSRFLGPLAPAPACRGSRRPALSAAADARIPLSAFCLPHSPPPPPTGYQSQRP